MAQTKYAARLRMTWDASMVEVGSVNEAVRKAKELGLGSFKIAEWRHEKEAWVALGFWAKGKDGNFVSVPASEGNE